MQAEEKRSGEKLEKLINESRFIAQKHNHDFCTMLFTCSGRFFELVYDKTRGKVAALKETAQEEIDEYLAEISIGEATAAGGRRRP